MMNLEAGRIRTAPGHSGGVRRGRRPSRRVIRARLYAMLAVLDVACIFASFLVGALIYQGEVMSGEWAIVSIALLPIYLLAAVNGHAYSAKILDTDGRGVFKAVQALALAIGALTFLAFYLKVGADFSRGVFTVGSVVAILSLTFVRRSFLHRARLALGGHAYSTVLISDGNAPTLSGDFSAYIAADSWLDPENDCPEMYDRLAMTLGAADRVVVSCTPERRLAWVQALKGANIRSEVVAPELAELAPLAVSVWGQTPTIVVADGPLSRVDALIKRSFDIAVASCAMILLSPLFLVVGLLIKLENPGPAFFMQTRIGQSNRLFKMYKFRSMRPESCDAAGAQSTSRDDDRITRMGAFIRKTSIDELPQLLNVLKGDMSIVGPRPHAVGSRAADKLFWEVDNRYWHRHATKPGLTGLAQIRGLRGATLVERDLTDRLYADLEYLRDWSIWKDLLIVFRTFQVLVHRNAY